MKIVKIKMLQDISTGDCPNEITVLQKGHEYFATDCGDYWLIQQYNGRGFIWIAYKKLAEEI
ncbi:hypothetical protein LCGC14_1633360 [marine sediment metagenome]|uniref:Uncharacterized protein n=1 Tax=marine sediment metagenome TaxID=412755 RepID=A0A0F9L1L5_9ZZZZ